MSGPVRKECLNFVISEKKEELGIQIKQKILDDEEEKEKELVVPQLGYINMPVSFKGCYLFKVE